MRSAVVLSAFLLVGCSSFGPGRLAPDRFDYNAAIAESTNEQMLLNLVRLRYHDVPVFLSVNSVLTQYVYWSVVGVNGSSGESLGDPLWTVGGNATYRYIERPTITYAPLVGSEFAEQLLEPISREVLFSLLQSGWPPEKLVTMGIYQLGTYMNVSFDPAVAEARANIFRPLEEIVPLVVNLAAREAFDLQPRSSESEERDLVFDENPDPATGELIERFKEALGLDPDISVFRLTRRTTQLAPDELTVRPRSLLEMMGFLSHGVEIPPAHFDESRARPVSPASDGDSRFGVPLRVRSASEEPGSAFIAVQYQDHWFYIEHSDRESKQAFALLAYLFQLQAPEAPATGPVVTVPTG